MVANLMTQRIEQVRPSELSRLRLGRGRLLALGVVVGLALVLGCSIWQVRSLGGLPDVGDPFDVGAARRPVVVPDEENAYVVYAGAHKGHFQFPAGLAKIDFKALSWSKAGQPVREFVEQKRPALERWREGSERPEALYHQPEEIAVDTLLGLVQDMRYLSQLAGLEGSRLEEDGTMGQAWEWYRAMLRFSRLVGRHGGLIERRVGASVHEQATGRILHWAADPRVDTKQLRRALNETIAADALTPPLSDALKFEYLIYLREANELRSHGHRHPLARGQGRSLGIPDLPDGDQGPGPTSLAPSQQ